MYIVGVGAELADRVHKRCHVAYVFFLRRPPEPDRDALRHPCPGAAVLRPGRLRPVAKWRRYGRFPHLLLFAVFLLTCDHKPQGQRGAESCEP